MSTTEDSARRSLDQNATWYHRFALGVSLGLAIEIVVLIWFGKDFWETFWLVMATAVILVGVYGERVFGKKMEVASAELDRQSTGKVAQANRDAETAKAQAAEAAREAERLKLQLAEAVARIGPAEAQAARAILQAGQANNLATLTLARSQGRAAGIPPIV